MVCCEDRPYRGPGRCRRGLSSGWVSLGGRRLWRRVARGAYRGFCEGVAAGLDHRAALR